MAIVISGVNNNDKITASDGTIDLLSGVNYAGIITAPAFTTPGNLTAGHLNIGSGIQLGNAGVTTATTFVGNLTGNVNATSNLLLQIGGSEKFRVASSGQLGIGGANYGTSGQVLTSGGSGSAATWSTISVGGGTGIDFNDDVKIRLGTGNDLEIYHAAGADSIIHHTATSGSTLRLRSRGFTFKNQANSATIATLNEGDACKLFFNGGQKFETTNTGVTVTGTVAATSFSGSGANLTALPASNRNLIENGEFLISQRFGNASSTKANSGTNIINGVENGVIDRWRMGSPSASNFARQRVTDAPDGFAYSYKITADGSGYSPSSNANYSLFQQIIEATNVARLAFGTSSAKTVTLSFYVKSSYASTWAVALGNTTGGVYVGNTTRTHIKSYTTNSANTWERKTITFPGDTSGTWAKTGTGGGLSVIFDLGSAGNHQGAATSTWVSSDDFRFSGAKNVGDSANGSWQITGIQLEIGSTATEYEHLPFQYELQRCQRYFYCGSTLASGSWNSATVFHCAVHHPVAMRGRVTNGWTRSGVLTNINIEPRDQYDITDFDPDAHTHYAPDDINSVQVMNFTISGSTTGGYAGTVSIDRNDDQFWLSAEL